MRDAGCGMWDVGWKRWKRKIESDIEDGRMEGW
jgi:hypothetical protein